MTGKGQFFWPNGAPLFKARNCLFKAFELLLAWLRRQGSLKAGKLVDGFIFDAPRKPETQDVVLQERCICHSHFRFNDEGEPELAGIQPEDSPVSCQGQFTELP